MSRFFDTAGQVLPYVDEKRILSKLHLLDSRLDCSDPFTQSWQALLNIIAAYALYTLEGPSPEPFYRRTLDLLYGTAIHLSTLQTRRCRPKMCVRTTVKLTSSKCRHCFY